MANESLEGLLQLVAVATSGVLARVWLNGPGDLCRSCPMRPECPDQTRCLHLVASAGVTTRTDGPFRRFPLGARDVGKVATTRAPFFAREGLSGAGLADPAWISTHRIQSFAAIPIEVGERCLGVLAVFLRRSLSHEDERLLAGAAACAAAIVSGLRDHATRELARPATFAPSSADATGDPGALEPTAHRGPRTLATIEREAIERALLHTGGRVSGPHGAAKLLGLKPTTLESRMKKLGARRPRR
jgi:transcriptional regulator with GAF, ATPase, and Fis domain